MDKKKKIDSIMEKTAEQLTGLVDVNTVIGKPIFSASGAQIIPFTEDECYPFAGGAGTVVNIKPAGFLIDDGNGCRIVKVTDDPLDGLIEKASELIGKFAGKRENEE